MAETAPMAPLGVVTSPAAKPVGTSEKVKVTSEVSPALRAESVKTMATVGGVVSITTDIVAESPAGPESTPRLEAIWFASI